MAAELKLMLACLVIEHALIQTRDRLVRELPERDWEYMGDHCLHQGELFLYFAEATERRMWWVRVDPDENEIAMSWNMEGMSELV